MISGSLEIISGEESIHEGFMGGIVDKLDRLEKKLSNLLLRLSEKSDVRDSQRPESCCYCCALFQTVPSVKAQSRPRAEPCSPPSTDLSPLEDEVYGGRR